MYLNDLLHSKDIDPQRVLVLRHRPNAPQLNKALPWLAAEKPDIFSRAVISLILAEALAIYALVTALLLVFGAK